MTDAAITFPPDLEDNHPRLMTLSPSSIMSTAAEDLRRCRRNRERAAKLRAGFETTPYENYAFLRRHVLATVKLAEVSPRALVEMAVAEAARGQASGKRWTRILYANPAILMQALGAGSP